MNPDGSFPAVKYDKKGRLVCPTCEFVTPIPVDQNNEQMYLGRGIGTCPNTQYRGGPHRFYISDEVAYAVNDILSKTLEGADNKRILKTMEELPDIVKPQKDGGTVFIP